ncbi:MAG: MBL fold metallo-hydrolase [Thermomicrobiales bacterium]|nr:MBL fold metallo-hydrolase [Thermomicrobiales bacterium]MCO5221365.1 MBL fold metallo-hydrolase [Thermomicrobiales bacterium]
MYFKQFLNELVGCASYLVASRQTGEAAIVDPGVDLSQYDALLRDRHFTLRYVIDTHIHADHVSGARALAAEHGAELCLFEGARVSYPFRPLYDGEELSLGQLRLRIVHTPGHRPELISILIINPERSPEPSMVLTGDSLLVGDVGRPDFGGGDAQQQYDSVGRLLRLPDWVAVFPGHFEGPCGKHMCGRPSTTVGFERLFNPIARMDREPFVDKLAGEVPARPLNMIAIEATNRGAVDATWAMLTQMSEVPQLSLDEFDAVAEGSFLVDVREPVEFASGHLPGSVNIPQAELATRVDELPRDRSLVTVCLSGARSFRSAQFLAQAGFSQVSSLEPGISGWLVAGRAVDADEVQPDGPGVVETEWAHAGAG